MEAALRVSVSLLAGFMLLAPVAAVASPVGLGTPAARDSSPIIEAAVKCGPHAHNNKGHRDNHGHYNKGRCVRDRHH